LNAAGLCGPLLVDELDDLRHQLGGNHHHGLIVIVEGGFDFGNRLIVALVVVILGEFANSGLVPAGRVLLFLVLDLFIFFSVRSHGPVLQCQTRLGRCGQGKVSEV
jgi:hypothetical protein